jgi:hypothetical protein
MARLCTSVLADDLDRREFMTAGMAFSSLRFGSGRAFAQEKRMMDAKKLTAPLP